MKHRFLYFLAILYGYLCGHRYRVQVRVGGRKEVPRWEAFPEIPGYFYSEKQARHYATRVYLHSRNEGLTWRIRRDT